MTSSIGVTATASTTATIAFNGAGTQSFTINGQQITASWASSSDYASVANAINQQTGVTGVTATLNGSSGIQLTNSTGADIAVVNTSVTTGNTISLVGTVNTGTQAAPNFTAGAAVTLAIAGAGNAVSAKVGGNISLRLVLFGWYILLRLRGCRERSRRIEEL